MFHLLEKHVQQAFQSHIAIRYGVEAQVVVEQPKQAEFGELALPVAFQLAKQLRQARADYRGNERFPLCSTFKVLAVAAVLKRVEAGRERLDRSFVLKRTDLVAYSPVLKDRVGDAITLAELCAAAMTESGSSNAGTSSQTKCSTVPNRINAAAMRNPWRL